MYTFDDTISPRKFVWSHATDPFTPPATSSLNSVATYSPAELKTTIDRRPSCASRHSISTGWPPPTTFRSTLKYGGGYVAVAVALGVRVGVKLSVAVGVTVHVSVNV